MSTFGIDTLSRSWPRAPAGFGTPAGPTRRSRVLVAALAASLLLHFAISLWPVEFDATPDMAPLSVTITELPPPPTPSAVAAVKKPKLRRVAPPSAPPPIAAPTPEPAPV